MRSQGSDLHGGIVYARHVAFFFAPKGGELCLNLGDGGGGCGVGTFFFQNIVPVLGESA